MVPALARSRAAARIVQCSMTLRGIVGESLSWGGSRNDRWPNAWDYPNLIVEPPDLANLAGENYVVGFGYTAQVGVWQGPFVENGWVPFAVDRSKTCPEYKAPPDGEPGGLSGAWRSYLYSIAMVTHPQAWEPQNEGLPVDRRWRSTARLSDVRFPSNKSVFFERAARHDNRLAVWEQGAGACNVVFADAHVHKVRPSDAVRAMRYETGWPSDDPPGDAPIPFNSTPEGVWGRDVR